MINIKNYQLNQDVIELINNLIEQKMYIVSGVKLSKIVVKIHEIVKEKQELEIKIVNKYAKKDEEGNIVESKDENGNAIQNTIEIAKEDTDDFKTEMENLEMFEHKLDFDPIDIETLGLDTSATMSIKDILKINFLFK